MSSRNVCCRWTAARRFLWTQRAARSGTIVHRKHRANHRTGVMPGKRATSISNGCRRVFSAIVAVPLRLATFIRKVRKCRATLMRPVTFVFVSVGHGNVPRKNVRRHCAIVSRSYRKDNVVRPATNADRPASKIISPDRIRPAKSDCSI